MFRLTSSKLAGKRVLIVEAEWDVVEIKETAVEAASGVVVFRAVTVDQAPTMLQRLTHVDCLLLDVATMAASDAALVEPCVKHGVELVAVAGDDAFFR
jgi:response regulator of citrate/malate metabolism